jgi:uncharacterized membrane protein YwaF
MFVPLARYHKASSMVATVHLLLLAATTEGAPFLYDKFTTVKTAVPLHYSDYSLYFCSPLLISSVWRIAFRGHHSKKIDHSPGKITPYIEFYV